MKKRSKKNKEEVGVIEYVKCPVESHTLDNPIVQINPLTEQVDWLYCYYNGEKRCYGYNILQKSDLKLLQKINDNLSK